VSSGEETHRRQPAPLAPADFFLAQSIWKLRLNRRSRGNSSLRKISVQIHIDDGRAGIMLFD